MGQIHPEVLTYLSVSHQEDRGLIDPFLSDFGVSWGRSRIAYNTKLSVYFLSPDRHITETFGFEHEIALFISHYDTIQPRTMQAIEQILNDDPARGRVDQTIFFLLTQDSQGRSWMNQYVSANPGFRIPVVLEATSLLAGKANAWSLRNHIAHQLFTRDLFHYQLPIQEDRFFFGRDSLVADHLDAIRRSQNIGLFGLRKTGKTSLILRVKRQLERGPLNALFYYDCKLPEVRSLNWTEFVNQIVHDIADYFRTRAYSSEKRVGRRFAKVLQSLPDSARICVAFDEIEYVSPLAKLDVHWKAEFTPFWQTLWSIQSTHPRLSFVISGVNPSVVEAPIFNEVQNPMFGIIRVLYLRGFELPEMRNMLRTFGRRMGLNFEGEALTYIYGRYGGHPLLTRMACSFVHKAASAASLDRPLHVSKSSLEQDADLRDEDLVYYCRHIINELELFYPDEYVMLELLANREINEFHALAREGDYTRHLRDYGIVAFDTVGRPRFEIPVLQRYIAKQSAIRLNRSEGYFTVPLADRPKWVSMRIAAIVAAFRDLEAIARAKKLNSLFGPNSFPEADKLTTINSVADQHQFDQFILVMWKSFVESIDNAGKAAGRRKYFFDEIRSCYPDVWDALHRIRVYRHREFHQKLEPEIAEVCDRFLQSDLDGRQISEVGDPWFILQQRTLDALLEALTYEIDRHT